MGKSGLIAHKLAATLTSTGTPAVFLHPAAALHGDAGLFTPGDVALFVSKSGESDELIVLLPYLERHGIPLVSVVTTPGSALARRSQAGLVTGPAREACPMDLTPTTSITLVQVMGGCLAVALLVLNAVFYPALDFLSALGMVLLVLLFAVVLAMVALTGSPAECPSLVS